MAKTRAREALSPGLVKWLFQALSNPFSSMGGSIRLEQCEQY